MCSCAQHPSAHVDTAGAQTRRCTQPWAQTLVRDLERQTYRMSYPHVQHRDTQCYDLEPLPRKLQGMQGGGPVSQKRSLSPGRLPCQHQPPLAPRPTPRRVTVFPPCLTHLLPPQAWSATVLAWGRLTAGSQPGPGGGSSSFTSLVLQGVPRAQLSAQPPADPPTPTLCLMTSLGF